MLASHANPPTGHRTRIAITGLGAVSAWGWGGAALRDGSRSCRTAIRPFSRLRGVSTNFAFGGANAALVLTAWTAA